MSNLKTKPDKMPRVGSLSNNAHGSIPSPDEYKHDWPTPRPSSNAPKKAGTGDKQPYPRAPKHAKTPGPTGP